MSSVRDGRGSVRARVAAMIALFMAISLLSGPEADCTVAGYAKGMHRQDAATRAQNRARVEAMARRVGAAPDVRAVLGTLLSRESSGNSCCVHTLGKGEFGLGLHGLSVHFHKHRWDARYPREVLFVPEVSTLATLRLFDVARTRYGATNWLQVHQVFATGRLRARPDKDARWCRRIETRLGIKCTDTPGSFGGRLLRDRSGQVEAVRDVQLSVLGQPATI